ncbi:MAG: hypothetical protein ACE5FY_06580 [Nitrospiria bacterium]
MTNRVQEHSPYVGHRPFSSSESGLFFGREDEAHALLALLLENQTLVLHGPSGVGKTSLLNAGLIPLLEKNGFEILKEKRHPEIHPINRTENAGFRVAIFDRFDTFFSSSSKRFKEREEFFRQLKKALEEDIQLRVVFVLRESHLAQLTSYAHFLPNRLETRFYLGPLRNKTALASVTRPLADTRRTFEKGVAENLVNTLSEMQTAENFGKINTSEDVVIESVLLQVVCKHLWDNLPYDVEQITQNHIQTFGDVNRALCLFYEKLIKQTTERSGAKEESVRRCFDQAFITHSKTREMVYKGETETGGIPNEAMDFLVEGHLVRREERAESTWYILIHDLLVKPILESNDTWRKQRSEGKVIRRQLENKAIEWLRLGRKKRLLLGQVERLIAEAWLESPDGRELGCSEALEAYVQASREDVTDVQHEEERKPVLDEDNEVNEEKQVSKEKQQSERVHPPAEPLLRPPSRRLRRFSPALIICFMIAAGAAAFVSQQRGVQIPVPAKDVAEIEPLRPEEQAPLTISQTKKIEAFDQEPEKAAPVETEVVKVSVPASVPISVPTPVLEAPKADQQSGEVETDLVVVHSEEVISTQKAVQEAPQKPDVNAEKMKKDVVQSEREAIEKSIKEKQVLSHSLISAATRNFPSNPTLSLSLIGHALSTSSFLVKKDRIKVDHILYHSITTLPVKKIFSGHTGSVKDVVFSGNRKVLASAGKDAKLMVWHLASEERRRTVKQKGPVNGLAFGSSNGRRLAAVSDAGIVTVWNPLSGQKILTLPEQAGRVYDVAFDPAGGRLATASGNTTASVWGLKSGNEQVKLIGHSDAVLSIAFSPDGKHVGTTGKDGTAMIWEASSGVLLVSLIGHTGPVMDVVFSPDGKYLATAGKDGTARIWDPGFSGQGGVQRVLSGHTGEVLKIVFSPDGLRLATASKDGTARVWDARTGEELIRIQSRRASVNSVAFSPDGKYLATASQDKKVRLYSLAVEDLMKVIPEKKVRLLTLGECKKYLHKDACPKKS